MNDKLFQSQRTRALEAYAAAQQPFEASTLPYHSTLQLVGDVAAADAVDDLAFLYFAPGQELRFFSYGIGDQIPWGTSQLRSGESETNIAKALSTNGASDFIIEGLGMSSRALRVSYGATAQATWDAGTGPGTGIIRDTLNGLVNIYDPAAIVVPPQCQSPFNLEDGLMQHLLPLLSLSLEWDRDRYNKLGTMDLLPRAGASSYLRSNGVPDSGNRFRLPEGFLWRRDGQPSSEFSAVVKLERGLIVPISLVTLPGASSGTQLPEHVYLDLTMRVFGLSVKLPTTF